MKTLSALALFFLTSTDLFAQSQKEIEPYLLKSFKKINYWYTQSNTHTSGTAIDSLTEANDKFGRKLQKTTSTYSTTITYRFNSLIKEGLNIISSSDGQFRIYSWDTNTGGTQHFFESVIQYKKGTKTNAILDTVKEEGDSRPLYNRLFTFTTSNNTYYLATYTFVLSLNEFRKGIQIFSIVNGQLNQKVNLIKTSSGLHSQLNYDYHISTIEDYDDSGISFDSSAKTITLPIVNEKGVITDKIITYKFTGRYFEKVKS
jgi:hypothetical protein